MQPDGVGLKRTAANRLISRAQIAMVSAESEVDLTLYRDLTTYFGTLPTGFKAFRRLVRYADGTYAYVWRTNIDFQSAVATYNSGAGLTESSYTVTYVMPSASGASDSNDGSSPTFVSGIIGPKATLSGLISDSTRRLIVLESGRYFSSSQGWATQELGADKIIVSSTKGSRAYLTARLVDLNSTSVTWAAAATNLWVSTQVSSAVANVVLPGVVDTYGATQAAPFTRPNTVCWLVADLATCQSTTNSCYYKAAITVTGATNANPIVITSSAAHEYANGDQVTIASVGGNTAANGTWYVKSTGSTTFELYSNAGLTVGVAGNGAYTSGGTITGVSRPQGIYVNNGSTTTAPPSTAMIHQNSARNLHANSTYKLFCRDIEFQGGSVVFSSTSGFQVSGATNATPIRITTALAHNFASGDQVTIAGVAGNTNANGTYYVTVISSTTFDLYTDVGRTTGRAGSGTYTSSTGYCSRGSNYNFFENCAFRYGGNSSTGSNIMDFNGVGTTFLRNCEWTDGRADGCDGRNGHLIITDNCFGGYTGINAGSSQGIEQAITMHAGAKHLGFNDEWCYTGGPLVQNAREQGVDAYHALFGCYVHSSCGTSSPARRYGLTSGTGSPDASRIWAVDMKWTAKDGSGVTPTLKYRTNTGTMYIDRVYGASEKTVDAGGTETLLVG